MSRRARPPRSEAQLAPPGDNLEQATREPRPGPSRDVREQRTEPEFGPSGYLPPKAARRARKIVLRAPLGLQWVVAALAAGIVVLVVGFAFLAQAGRPPGAPYVEVGPVEAIGDARYDDERGVLFVAAAGRVRAFVVPDLHDVPVFCSASDHLESAAGRVWRLTGRGLDGGPSLDQHPTVVMRGVLYLDPSTRIRGPAPEDTDAEPTCF